MKYNIDELLLNEIDDETGTSSDLFSMLALKNTSLVDHTSVNCKQCAITELSYNKAGTYLATGCARGLVYVHAYEVSSTALSFSVLG